MKNYLLLMLFACSTAAIGQPVDTAWFSNLKYRFVGPNRGGRVDAVCGIPGNPYIFYMGATGGGVWKTTDAGNTWNNISDTYFGGSVGSIAISEADHNIIFVGTGEGTLRGNVSHGDGIWRSDDAGKTWVFSGLKNSRHIPKIVTHPKNSDIAIAAVLGHVWGPNEERGLYRTTDGGKTWNRVAFVNKDVGFVDVCYDPLNPRIVYASSWRVRRTPYSLDSGGEGCGLWKSTDGGATFVNITANEGLPKGTLGIIGVSASAARQDLVMAIIENLEGGGVYRSDNGGKTWRKTNSTNDLRQRAWYFSKITCDPQDADVVYVGNVGLYRSEDGGNNFRQLNSTWADHHALWIDPTNNTRMIMGNDAGASVSVNRGESWSGTDNQPTGQFYRLSADNDYPYRILSAQQDRGSIRMDHLSGGWGGTAGFESGYIVASPNNPKVVFGGNYGGSFNRYDHESGESRDIDVWPNCPIGSGAGANRYRFQWNFPIFFSPNDPNTLYAAANVLFKSKDEGQSWTPISPDLTTNTADKLGPSGGPITKDNTTVEYYCTIFAAAESPVSKGLLWVGSDDGLIHISRDGGQHWENVTPSEKIMPKWAMINCVEPSPFDPATVYVAATAYKNDDFKPYLLRSDDYGKTWKRIIKGIDDEHFTRAVRSHPTRKGLLFCGTERGVYISFDNGDNWQAFQLNLPVTPVTDLLIKNNDLIVSTQGRAIWSLDDMTSLLTMSGSPKQGFVVYDIPVAYRGGSATIDFFLKDTMASMDTLLKINIYDDKGKLIRSFTPKGGDDRYRLNQTEGKLTYRKGHNRFKWNLRYPDPVVIKDMALWNGSMAAPLAPPGRYKVRVFMGKDSIENDLTVLKSPKVKASDEELVRQSEFLISVSDKLSAIHKSILNIRDLRGQISSWKGRFDPVVNKDLIALADSITRGITAVEEALYQTKSKANQDNLNYPIRLNDKLFYLANHADGNFALTQQALGVREELFAEADKALNSLRQIYDRELKSFNEGIIKAGIMPVSIKQ